MKLKSPYSILLAVLFVSGASGLINQIAWQRAVKIYLGNSETLSSMIVVLVFMLGLGIGSLVAARRGATFKNPFRILGMIEVFLCIINIVLIFVFGEELRRYGHALQAIAVDYGISASLLLAVLSFVVLIVPCFLMGLTIPIAAEAAQRQLNISKKNAVSHFFILNTVGAVVGTLGCGLILIPVFGQKTALAFAASGNLLAGVLILLLLSPLVAKTITPEPGPKKGGLIQIFLRQRSVQNEEVLAFVLGFLSLGYEIYLLRILSLAYTPLPWIFSVVLCGFLLFWSLGLAISEHMPDRTFPTLIGTALAITVVPFILSYHRFQAVDFPIWSAGLLYFLPCIGFGMLFGITIRRYAKQWGRDVGVFTALNTVGSGLGIVVTTFVLFKIDKDLDAWILSAGLLVLAPFFFFREYPSLKGETMRRIKTYTGLAFATFLITIFVGLAQTGPVKTGQQLEFYGSDGVVEVRTNGRVYVNGLWHSVLYRDDNREARRSPNIRRKMLIALLPFLAHSGEGPKSVLNIGMGTGATARTLAKSTTVESVDTYEIVTTLKDVIAHFPEETLGTEFRSKINIFWEDARAGMVRREKKYDIITQSPLYLKQAGSSFLLSREYFELVKSRLKDDGIVGIYCNSQGNPTQSLLVRTTVSKVFPYYESFGNGYFILASNNPIEISSENFNRKLLDGDPIVGDIKTIGVARVLEGFDRPRLDWLSSPYVITDDHPLVEYPLLTRWLTNFYD